MSLFEGVGSVDNLDEATPFFNNKAAIYGFVITFLAITTFCASLRLYVRFFVTRSPGWDDYFIILIFILSWITNIGSLYLVKVGLGKHFITLTYAGMKRFVKMFWWCNATYNMSMAAIKLSLLFQYLRLLSDHPTPDLRQPRLLRLCIVGLIVITSIWGLVYSVLAWVPCIPISADWNFDNTSAIRYGYGSDRTSTFVATYLAHGACNMAIDLAIFCLPLFSRSMWTTAGRQRQSRIAMLCLYALGLISVICSVIRFASLVENRATTYPTFDPTWYGPTAIVLSMLEVDIATVMASLPVFWPYLRRNIDKIMITHEIEVKVTDGQHFTQIDDDHHYSHGDSGNGGSSAVHNNNYNNNNNNSNNNMPWMMTCADDKGSGAGAGLKMGNEVVMMRDLGLRTGAGRRDEDLPFDGSTNRLSPGLPSPNRAHFLGPSTRDSKEVLLK